MSAPDTAPTSPPGHTNGASEGIAHGEIAASAPGIGVTLATVTADIIELGAFGGHAAELSALASSRGITLPAFGRSTVAPPAPAPELAALASSRGVTLPAFGHSTVATPAQATAAPATALHALVLCVRPDRWLLLSQPTTDGLPVGPRCAAAAAAVQAWSAATAGIGIAVDLSAGLTALLVSGGAVREVLARACRLDLHPAVFPVGQAAATQMVQVSVILVALPSAILLLTPSTTARHVREWLMATSQPFGFAPRATISLDSILRTPAPGPAAT